MGEKNPLQVSLPPPAITTKLSNKSGRPTTESIVKFSPQPKSIVAQMLSKMNKNNDVDRNVHFADETKYSLNVMNDVNSYKGEENKILVCLPLRSPISNFTSRSKPALNKNELSTQSKSEIFEEMKRTEVNVIDGNEEILTDQQESALSSAEEIKELPKHRQFVCDFPNCKYSCKLSSNLIKHKRVHTNEKPYLCEKCSFRSNFVNSLKAHKRTHTAERPYQCKNCDYKCNSSSNLKKHCLHRHPTSTSDCPYVT